jgi:hypothetical protein
MFNQLKWATGALITATLVACGGGGDSGSAAPVVPTGPVASTETFAFKTAYVNLVTTSQTKTFKISASGAGQSVSGSGTVTFGSLSPATFEGKTALTRSITASGSLAGNGQAITIPISSSNEYYDSNYNPLGESDDTEYAVIDNIPPSIPQTVKVGGSGVLYTFMRYNSSTKNTLLGTSVYSYVVEPDTATTALVTVVETVKDTAGKVTVTSGSVFRITPSGGVSLVKETVTDLTNLNVTWTATYD